MRGTRRPSACVHGVLFSGYRVAKSVRGMHASVHGVADSVHGVADSVDGVADSVNGLNASVHGLPERGHRLPVSDYGLPVCGDRLAESGYSVTRSGYGAADRGDRRAALSAVIIRLHRYVGGMKKGRILSETALFYRGKKVDMPAYAISYSSMLGQVQIRFLSPRALSTRPTGGQNLEAAT